MNVLTPDPKAACHNMPFFMAHLEYSNPEKAD